jgi:hypothetical protein
LKVTRKVKQFHGATLSCGWNEQHRLAPCSTAVKVVLLVTTLATLIREAG